MSKIENHDFNKIIKDLIKDLALVFPDIIEKNKNDNIINILKYIEYEISIQNEDETYVIEDPDIQLVENYKLACNNLLLYCLDIYPKIFFEILYKNEELFKLDNDEVDNDELDNDEVDNDEVDKNLNKYNTYLLPDIDFKLLFNDNKISEKTRETLWNYLQIILFSIITNIETENTFGEAAKLFEAFDNEKLFEKFSNVFEDVKNLYNTSNIDNDISNNLENNIFNNFNNFNNINNNSFDNLPEANEMYDHLKSILNGKIGQLATEFGEELYNELDLKDLENSGAKDINDIYKNLFKNPSKIFNVIEKMGTKLDEKIKSGELSQKEILEESTKMLGSLTNNPDMSGNPMNIFKDLMDGLTNNKNFNKTGFNNMLNREKMKNKMREKLNKREEEKNLSDNKSTVIDEDKMKNNLFDLLKDESKDLKDLNNNLTLLMEQFTNTNINKSKNRNKRKKTKK
jgi:hypothetical protein